MKALQKNRFAGNLDLEGDTTMLFIIEEAKETISVFPQATVFHLQLSKLKSGIKNSTELTLYISLNMISYIN